MSDDLEVILEEDPVVPSQKPNLPEALMYNFFERDPYTRRHRSRSMAEQHANVPVGHVDGIGITNGSNGNSGIGQMRLKSAEV